MPPNNKPFSGEATQPIPVTEDSNSNTSKGSTFGEWTDEADKKFREGMARERAGNVSPTVALKDFTIRQGSSLVPAPSVGELPDPERDTVRDTLGGEVEGNVLPAVLPEDGVVNTTDTREPAVTGVLKVLDPKSEALDKTPRKNPTPETSSSTPKPPKRLLGGILSSMGTNRLVKVITGAFKKTSDFAFQGLESKGELTISLSRVKDKGVTELKYKELLNTLNTIKDKISEEEHAAFLKTIESLRKKAKDKEGGVEPQPKGAEPHPNNVLQTLAKEAGKKLYLSYSGKDTSLSNTQLNALLGVNTVGLTKKHIDDLVDVAIKKDLEKLRAQKSPVPTVSITTKVSTPLTKTVDKISPPEDLFEDGFDDEVAKKETSQERLRNWKERLENVATTTKNKLETTLEKLGPSGKKLVSLLTQGSEYLNTQTNSKAVKLFAAAGLVSAGALAAYATPVVLASMAGVGLGLRVVSAAGAYTFARKQLDKKYESWEREGKKKSVLSMAGYEAGAIGFALFSGEVVGKVFEGIASMPVLQEIGTSIKNVANVADLTEYWTNFWNGEASSSNTASMQPEASTQVEAATIPTAESAAALTTPPNPDLQHVVKKGDNLWSLLRKDLANMHLDGFNDLSTGKQERIMRAMLDELNAHGNIPSGSIDKIYPGEVIDYNKIDFKNYLDKYLKN